MSSYPGAAQPPHPDIVPNVEHPEDVLRTINYAVQGLTVFFVTVFVAIRFYAKYKVLGTSLTWDDCATYASYVLMVGYCITACFAGHHGGGLNIWEVSKQDITPFFQSGYAATIFYMPMALTVKLALVLIIIRVFGTVHKKTLMGIYVFIGMIVIYYVSGFFIKIFVCWPIASYWRGESENCLDQSAIITADAIVSVISDLFILLVPTPLTWSLQLPLKKRLRVIGILCAGGVATAFSVYRLILILTDGKSPNQTIVFIKVILSGNAEAGIGLICACLPSISALIVRHNRGTSYYGYQQSHSQQKSGNRNEIMMTRSFQVDTSSRSTRHAKDEEYDIAYDEAGLVADVQANPRSNYSSRQSDSPPH